MSKDNRKRQSTLIATGFY